jgi:hypothetical protein
LHQELKTKHEKLIDAINTGDKPTEDQQEAVVKVARAIAASYAVEEKKTKTDEK